MSSEGESVQEVPAWIAVSGTVCILGHFIAVIAVALAAPSGPWPSPAGGGMSTPPQFAYSLAGAYPVRYLHAVGMLNSYHFLLNRPALPGAAFEVRLKDASGNVTQVVTVPSAESGYLVGHREGILARALADDQPVEPPQGEVIAAPGQAVPSTRIWEMEGGELVLRDVAQHLIPRDRPVFRPSERSLLLARSFARYALRRHGGASAEVVRHTREAIPPAVLFLSSPPPPNAEGVLKSNFGEFAP
ncbi:MAG: hypothetical protein FJ297_07470 [Planctomycetes bacterium]|nr:hypothetical protein [Planctomycetota bacterium]